MAADMVFLLFSSRTKVESGAAVAPVLKNTPAAMATTATAAEAITRTRFIFERLPWIVASLIPL